MSVVAVDVWIEHGDLVLCRRRCLIITGRIVAKVIFMHLSVILFTRGVSASVHAGIHTPWEQTHSLGADTPKSRHPGNRHPQEQTSPRSRPLGSRHPCRADTPTRKQTPAYGQ